MRLRLRRGPGNREDPYKAEPPCLAGTVIGVREWTTNLSLSRLGPLTGGQSWSFDGTPTRAKCVIHPIEHQAPDPDCECGLYAHHPWTSAGKSLTNPDRYPVNGVTGFVVAWGHIEVHAQGFRAEYAKPAAFFLANGVDHGWAEDYFAEYELSLRRLAAESGADLIDTRVEGAAQAWLEQHPGQLRPETIDRLLPGVRVGPVRITSASQVMGWVESGIVLMFKGTGRLIYGLLMAASITIQLLWWGFILYMLIAFLTGLDPFHLGSSLGPDPADPVIRHPEGWHPPMAQ